MANIFIHGVNAKTGGGKSILNNYLTLLQKSDTSHNYFILTPDKEEYEKYSSNRVKIVNIKKKYKKNIFFIILNYFILPRKLRQLNIDVVFNLSDVAIPVKVPQIYLFDWSYAIYSDRLIWKRMDFKSYLKRRIKLYFFKVNIKYPSVIIAQTQIAKDKLELIYGLRNIKIIPNAVSLDNVKEEYKKKFNLPEGIKLLYLTYYYPHKNIEILIPLAMEIKKKKLNFKIVTTICESQHKRAKIFLNNVRKLDIEDVIINIGPVDMKFVPSIYRQCDGLLMPTLLESFSGTYVEAMYHNMPIFTSDIDFAHDVCGEAAFYFNPLDVGSILGKIEEAYSDSGFREQKVAAGDKRLKQFLSWEQVFKQYQKILEISLEQ